MLVSVTTIAVIAAGLTVFSGKQAESARATACHGSLTCIAVAMHEYHEKYGHFPPAYIPDKDRKPKHSWRILLLEFMDVETFKAYHFDEAWNGPNNKKLEHKLPSCYTCPADPAAKVSRETNYFVVIGPATVFPGEEPAKLGDIQRSRADTILAVEAVGRGVHWMKPEDFYFRDMSFQINDTVRPGISSRHKRAPAAVMVDGSKVWLSNISPQRLRTMFIIKDLAP